MRAFRSVTASEGIGVAMGRFAVGVGARRNGEGHGAKHHVVLPVVSLYSVRTSGMLHAVPTWRNW
jgi:hypothetical protein